jgi:hypothetical protein
MRRRQWVREGDLIIVWPWDFQDAKADVKHRYTKTQAMYLSRKGVLPDDVDVFGMNVTHDDDDEHDDLFGTMEDEDDDLFGEADSPDDDDDDLFGDTEEDEEVLESQDEVPEEKPEEVFEAVEEYPATEEVDEDDEDDDIDIDSLFG